MYKSMDKIHLLNYVQRNVKNISCEIIVRSFFLKPMELNLCVGILMTYKYFLILGVSEVLTLKNSVTLEI